MSWFLLILFLTLTFDTCLTEATNHDDNKKILPSAFVVGTVYCDTCLQQTFTKESHFISGASIAVECKVKNSKQRFYTEVKTNEHGEFKVKLPFLLKKHVKRIKRCSLRLISSSEPHCSIASATTSTNSLSLKKKFQGEHIFSAGDFSFKPMKKPSFCVKKHSFPNSKVHVFKEHKHSIANFKEHVYVMKSSKKSDFSDQKQVSIFPPLIPNPFQPPPLIPNPLQPPSPPLIPNPFQPSPPPFLPNPFQPPSPPPFLPNPLQPPPSSPPPFLPNPFQPPPSSPPPFLPNPFQPPPSSPPPSFPFPPIVIPGLTPSPPPPPPPPKSVFPFPLPPLFPPPHSPGSPPTSSKHS